MKNTSVTLSDHFQQFVDTQVNQGHYASTSEVIRAGLRLLEEQEIHKQKLRDEILKGVQSGMSPRSMDDVWNDELKALKQ